MLGRNVVFLWTAILTTVFVMGEVASALIGPVDASVAPRAIVWVAGVIVGLVTLGVARGMQQPSWERIRSAGKTMEELASEEGLAPLRMSAGDRFEEMAERLSRARIVLEQRIRRLTRSRDDLQTMLETMPEGVLVIDVDQCIVFANASVARFFGLRGNSLTPGIKLWEALRHPGLQQAVRTALENRGIHDTEFEVIDPPRNLSLAARPLVVGAGPGMILLLRDVSELRRLEKIRQDFFANVSHELKTPLASIKAYTETLLDAEIEDRFTHLRFLHRIEEQADRLHALVIDMLMLARAESEDHGFVVQPVEPGEIVTLCADAYREKADSKNITLSTELQHQGRAVLADPEGLLMALRNLVDNAIKYTPEGGAVRILTGIAQNSVLITVADTGVGIPEEELGRVFERFYRVDKARSRELGGTGLGLSIVKHLVQTFGGSVSVTSRLGHGTSFRMRLPGVAPPFPSSGVPRPASSTFTFR